LFKELNFQLFKVKTQHTILEPQIFDTKASQTKAEGPQLGLPCTMSAAPLPFSFSDVLLAFPFELKTLVFTTLDSYQCTLVAHHLNVVVVCSVDNSPFYSNFSKLLDHCYEERAQGFWAQVFP
jgi:hypothetical protein